MAQIHEEIIIIKLSKLVKLNGISPSFVTDELVSALASVAEELAGDGIVVEAERA